MCTGTRRHLAGSTAWKSLTHVFSMGTSVSVDRGGCQFEGSQCGSSGVPIESFTNAACCNQAPSRSLADAQAHVVAEIHGQKETV